MGRRIRRRLSILALTSAGLAILGLTIAHSPPVRARVLRWAQALLASRYGLVLAADGLSYNLVTLAATMGSVRLAAAGAEAEPFFTADRVHVNLPLAALTGRLILDEVAIDRGRIAIVTAADGSSNLPSRTGTAGAASAEPRTLVMRALTIGGLDVRYANAARDVEIEAAGIDAALEHRSIGVFDGITGPLAIRGGVDVRFGSRTLRVEPLDTRLAFEGSSVSVQALPIKTRLFDVAVSGRLDRVLDAPVFDLTFEGDADAGRVSELVWLPVPIGGKASVRGSVSGPAAGISSTVRLDAPLTIGDEAKLSASAEVTVDTRRVEGHRVHVEPESGGRIDASFVIPIGEGPVEVQAVLHELDARVLFRAATFEPQPIGARLDGEISYRAPGPSVRIEALASPLQAPGLVPIDLRVSAGVEIDRWRLSHELRSRGLTSSGTTSGHVHDTDWRQTTLEGSTRVAIASLQEVASSLEPFGIDIPAAARDRRGAIDAQAALSGTLGDPRATVAARAPAIEVPSIGDVAVDVTVDLNRRHVALAPITITHGATEAKGELTMDLETGALGGRMSSHSPDVRDLLSDVPDNWRASGPVTADVAIGGSIDEPTADIRLASPSVVLAGETLEGIAARARVTESGVDVASLALTQRGAGRLDASGRFGFDGSYALHLDAHDLAWRGVLIGETETRATFAGTFDGAGTVERPEGTGRFDVALTGGLAGAVVGTGRVDVSLAGDRARFTGVLPALGAFANGEIMLAAPYDYRAVSVFNRVDLSSVAVLAGADAGQVEGHASLTAAADGAIRGDRLPIVEANLQGVDATMAGVPLVVSAPARVTWHGGGFTVADFAATLGAGTLVASGSWPASPASPFEAAFRGELADVLTAARAFDVETNVIARGRLGLDVRSTGREADTTASLDLTEGRMDVPGGIAVTDLNARAELAGETLTLRSLAARFEAVKAVGTLSASGSASIPDLDVTRATGRVVLDRGEFDASGLPVRQVRPSTLTVTNGIVSLDDVEWEAAGTALSVTGQIDLTAEGAPALHLAANGTAALRVLSAFVPAVAIDGTADLDVRVSGTTGDPDLSGTLTLRDGELALASPRILVEDLSGPVRLAGDRIELQRLRGTVNGGALTVDGGFALQDAALASGTVSLQAQGMAVEYPRGLRSEVDALLVYDLSAAGQAVSGDVRVLRSSYTQPISLAALAATGATVTPREGASAVDDLRLDVAVTSVEDVLVDNNYGRFESDVALRVVGTVGEPGLTGRIALREGGRVYAAGRTFTITRGTVSFDNTARIEPELDIQAQTRVTSGGVGDVSLTIQGTPDRLTTDLTSSENKGRQEIASALFGGGVMGPNALSLLSGDLLGLTGRQVGLDAVRIEREDVAANELRQDPSVLTLDEDPTTRLTISKRIRDNVEFTFSQNLRESGKITYVVSYFPLPNLELRAVSRDDADYGIGVRHQVTFGGGGRAAARPRSIPPAIHSVVLEGDLAPLGEADLRREIRTDAGGRFDFYQWQRDLDRLRQVYVDRGYLEARVRGRRVEREPGEEHAIFTIRRGPLARIVVDGHTLGADEERGIRETWAAAVFDRFLMDDAEARVRRHLVAGGYLEGAVSASIESSGETKTLHLTVTPGVRAERREIRFSGNTALTNGRLQEVVTAAGLELQAWMDPKPLVEELTRLYREAGYLGASVTVESARLEGTTGVLPVSIREGPQAAIDRVDLVGVADDRQAWVGQALDLDPPAPYTAARVGSAREQVLRRYRQRGFNSADVRITVETTAESSVGLTVAVAEGPQQVLQEVQTSGADRTREGVVDRALRLRLGAPVNLEEWDEARRRLYDINVFRSVDIQAVPLGDPVDGVQRVRALVVVEEYPHWRLRYGFQLDRERIDEGEDGRLDTHPGGTAELRNANLLGRAIAGGLAARLERDYQNASLFLSNASAFGLPVRSSLFVYGTHDNTREGGEVLFVTTERGLSLEQRWRRRTLELSYGYRYARTHNYDPDPIEGDPNPLDVFQNKGRLNAAVFWDRRTNPLDATTGLFSAFSWERSAYWLGADSRYGKILAQQQFFLSKAGVVLASRGIVGTIYGPDDVEADDRFRAGGGTSVRGYAENALGPQGIAGSLGGRRMVVLNQEARFPLYRWLRGVGFVDAGNVLAGDEGRIWTDLRIGYGVGLRLNSPLGLLRLDYGIPGSTLPASTRQANDIGSGRWYFGFGHIF